MSNFGLLTFASEADMVALTGAAFFAFALVALTADKLRSRRERIDKLDQVGWVPWTAVFMASAIIGGGLLALSLPTALFGN